jgi:hypothetical protein
LHRTMQPRSASARSYPKNNYMIPITP